MNICQMRMKDYLPQHAAEVFGSAGKHDYPHLIAAVAPLLIGKPVADVVHLLPMHILVPWAIYQVQWAVSLTKSLSLHPNMHNGSWVGDYDTECIQKIFQVQAQLPKNISFTSSRYSFPRIL
ncbi:hypothetical protein GYMLUDRAFT_700700 [Collybiopsis luxurians FD-317 M1]|uniref:Uncharacterized protein n=1 Tax=Collybiopsis luxurians FD-317 M1 TaxID=944289 RepID=A0A0D0CRK0_9AGAR|nr:hypothetical protein GYMLUDRAFT_700700 [Collybiopsis luxurians FD-317 M1]